MTLGDEVSAAVLYPLAYPGTLKLGDRSHELQGKLAMVGRGVQTFLGGDKLDTLLLQAVEIVEQEPQVAEEAVEFANDDDVEPLMSGI